MPASTITRIFTAFIIPVGMIGIGASVASATQPSPDHKVTICHATASKTNPYVVITVDVASIGDTSGHGRSGVNEGDIIPPFDIAGKAYAGNNWDAAHTDVALRECGLVIPPDDNGDTVGDELLA
jgi:hypothetical protein